MTHTGKVGAERDITYGQAAAVCALNLLAVARAHLGSLDKIEAVLQLNGFVNAIPSFPDSPAVINGASDVLVEILGDAGRHTRAALAGYRASLDSTVELPAVLQVRTLIALHKTLFLYHVPRIRKILPLLYLLAASFLQANEAERAVVKIINFGQSPTGRSMEILTGTTRRGQRICYCR